MVSNLRRRLALAALVLAVATTSACAHAPAPVPDERAARAVATDYYAQLRRAVAQRDALALKSLYDELFTHTHGSGKVDGREARIVSLLTGEPTAEMQPDHETVVDMPDSTVVTVRGKGPIPSGQDNMLYQYRWLQVLVKRDGRWRMVVSQATRLPDAPVPNPNRK